MSRDYGKVHTSFWSSETIRALSEDGRVLALYLMTSPHTTITGTFRLPDGYACEDLKWTSQRVQKGFAELFANGFANRCETTKWVWIVKHMEWNPPENPNQRKAAAKQAQLIPSECGWKRAFMRASARSLEIEWDENANPSETLSQPFLNQKQKQEQEQEQKTARKARAVSLPEGFGISERVKTWAGEKGFANLDPHFDALVSYAKRKGATYADWDEALMEAIRKDWGGTGSPAVSLFAGAR